MPVSNAIVLKSIPLIASSCVKTPDTIMAPPPSSAMIERLSRSVMISRYVRARSSVATHMGSNPRMICGDVKIGSPWIAGSRGHTLAGKRRKGIGLH